MNRPKRTSLLLPLLFLLVVALSMGAAPLSAYEEGPDSLAPTPSVALEGATLEGAALEGTSLEGTALDESALEAAADASAPVEVTNDARTIASGLAVSNNRFAVKATGTGEGSVAAVEVEGDLTNTTVNEGQSSDPLFATLIAYGLGAGAVSARVNGGVSIAPSSVAQNPKEFCSIFNKVSAGTSSIEVTGDVSATGKGDATCVKMDGDSGSKASLKVGQSMIATSTSEGEEEYDSFAADIQASDASEITLEVGKDVRAEAGDSRNANACGVRVTSVSNPGNPAALCVARVQGDIEATGTNMAVGAKLSAQEGSCAQLEATGDSV